MNTSVQLGMLVAQSEALLKFVEGRLLEKDEFLNIFKIDNIAKANTIIYRVLTDDELYFLQLNVSVVAAIGERTENFTLLENIVDAENFNSITPLFFVSLQLNRLLKELISIVYKEAINSPRIKAKGLSLTIVYSNDTCCFGFIPPVKSFDLAAWLPADGKFN
jgi:hypothetical protein